MHLHRIGTLLTSSVLVAALVAGCGAKPADQPPASSGQPQQQSPQTEAPKQLSGTVLIDGSSTVFPVTEAIAEEFQKLHTGVKVTVGVSGTGGGFKKFTAGETDISNASRPIKDTEAQAAQEHQIAYLELPIAYDGLSVVVNRSNDFLSCLTTDDLQKIWEPESSVRTWKDVRSEWPDQPIKLYGPGTDSGTFDYFTEVITGKSGASRADFTASEDDNVLVQGVAGDKYALGYFGFVYALENQDKLKIVPIDSGNGCVSPSDETILNGTYSPLSRPIYIYVSKGAAAQKPEVAEFVRFYMNEGPNLVKQVGYTPMPTDTYKNGLNSLEAAIK